MKRAPEAPGASQRAHASPKRTVLAEEGGGTSFGTARSGSTCLEHGQSPSSPSWLQPQPSSGGLPPQPQSCPGPSRPSQLRAGRAPSRSPGLSFCGFPLCLQQHPRNIVSNQLSSFPTQSDFLHSAARPVPGDRATRATCWWSLSSSQLGQREKKRPRDSSCGARGRAGMRPQLTGFRCCRCPSQQDKRGSERQHQRPELVPGELAQPPSRAPRVSVRAAPRLLSAASRKLERG